MSSRILTPNVIGIDAFVADPAAILAQTQGGAVAVFANNAPAFYAVTPERLAQLLALEEKLARPGKAGLHFVDDEKNAVFVADLAQGAKKLNRRII